MRSCASCKNVKCRCADCYALVEINGKWFCADAEEYCEAIEYCWSYDSVYVDEDIYCREVKHNETD